MTQATFTGRHGGTAFRRIYLTIGAAAVVAGGAILAHPWSGSSTDDTPGDAYQTSWQRSADTTNASTAAQIEAARIEHDNAFPLSAVLTIPSREVDGSAAIAEHDAHIDAWLAGGLWRPRRYRCAPGEAPRHPSWRFVPSGSSAHSGGAVAKLEKVQNVKLTHYPSH